jgi:hypothetical protein
MFRRLALPALIALSALAVLPAAASAGWFPAAANPPVDGPSPDIVQVGGLDLARDGSGGLVYLKKVDGVPHVFLSRFNGGVFRAPERVDNGVGGGASAAVIAAADTGRLAIAWTSGSRVYGSVVAGNGPSGPLLGPTEIFNDPSGATSDPAIDMGINGTAYATWAAPGGGGADVRVARLQDVAWQTIGVPIDVDPARAAGRGVQRSRVAVSGDGNALVAWGEDNADGRRRVWERRVTGVSFSAFPQELSLPNLGGAPGGAADSVDIDVEDDGGFGWAVFRQDFGGGSRSIGRRLLGLTFDPPVALDGGPPTANPRLALNGRGQGLSTFEGGSGALAAINYNDVFQPAVGLNFTPTAGAAPVPAASEHREVVAAWQQGGEVKGRLKPLPTKPFDNEVTLSRPDLGPAAGPVAVGADLLGGFAVAMAQGPATSRAITVAVQDNVPGRPGPIARNAWQNGRRAKLRWRAGRDLWGQLRYRVIVGGKVAGETTGLSLVPKVTLSGKRPLKYQVIAIDVRGQQTASPVRSVRFDNLRPKFRVRIGGKRRAGRALHVVVKPRDRGSGVREVRVRYGDSKRVVKQRRRFSGRHAYRRGTFTLKVTVYDVAGNRRIKKVKLHIT